VKETSTTPPVRPRPMGVVEVVENLLAEPQVH
jgi:hypothetical protein